MAADKIMTWADFRDERVGALGSIWHNREPSYPDFLVPGCGRQPMTASGRPTPARQARDAALTLEAYVDWGRWLVKCICGAPSVAEVAEDYLCPLCEEWHSVEFPSLKS